MADDCPPAVAMAARRGLACTVLAPPVSDAWQYLRYWARSSASFFSSTIIFRSSMEISLAHESRLQKRSGTSDSAVSRPSPISSGSPLPKPQAERIFMASSFSSVRIFSCLNSKQAHDQRHPSQRNTDE